MTMDDRRKLIAEARVKAAWSRHSKTIHDLASALSDTLDQVERLREVARAMVAYEEALDRIANGEKVTNIEDIEDNYYLAVGNIQPDDLGD